VTVAEGTCGALRPGAMLFGRMTEGEPAPLERAMSRFAAGEDAALGDVYDLASPAVFTFLLRICRDRSMAEDLTQETFLRIHRARGLYRAGAAVMPWAYTIARRLFLDAVRVRRSGMAPSMKTGSGEAGTDTGNATVRELATTGPSAEDLLSNQELSRAVDDALARIPENQAAAFRLLKGEGLSVAETAVIMGTTRGAVKLRAHRAYEALRRILGGHLSGTTEPRTGGKGGPR
jgi:RNA polymerase sigma-70 factor, ECF subfamily